MCSLKAFMFNSLSPRKTSMLKPLEFYMLLNVFNYLIMFSMIFEVQFYAVRKLILGDFVWRKGITFILK